WFMSGASRGGDHEPRPGRNAVGSSYRRTSPALPPGKRSEAGAGRHGGQPVSWNEYSHECDACWRNYNSNPPSGPCHTHKGMQFDHGKVVQTDQPVVEDRMVFGYTWRE